MHLPNAIWLSALFTVSKQLLTYMSFFSREKLLCMECSWWGQARVRLPKHIGLVQGELDRIFILLSAYDTNVPIQFMYYADDRKYH